MSPLSVPPADGPQAREPFALPGAEAPGLHLQSPIPSGAQGLQDGAQGLQPLGVRLALVAFVTAATTIAAASPQVRAGQRLAFVACPIVRDTATLPCWLVEHRGELYYLGTQGSTSSQFYPPELLHEALVEATVAEGPRVCGGIPLTSLDVSVRPELNRACNTVLPAEPQYSAPPSPPAPLPRYADTARDFAIPYDFDSDYLTLHTTRIVDEVARIAKIAKPAVVEVHGRRGATRLTDGSVLVERPGLSQQRAEKMATMLAGLGVPKAALRVTWQADADTPDGINDVARRRLTILLK